MTGAEQVTLMPGTPVAHGARRAHVITLREYMEADGPYGSGPDARPPASPYGPRATEFRWTGSGLSDTLYTCVRYEDSDNVNGLGPSLLAPEPRQYMMWTNTRWRRMPRLGSGFVDGMWVEARTPLEAARERLAFTTYAPDDGWMLVRADVTTPLSTERRPEDMILRWCRNACGRRSVRLHWAGEDPC